MAKFKYAVDLMLEVDADKPLLKKAIKKFVEEAIEDTLPTAVLITARVRSVDLD